MPFPNKSLGVAPRVSAVDFECQTGSAVWYNYSNTERESKKMADLTISKQVIADCNGKSLVITGILGDDAQGLICC